VAALPRLIAHGGVGGAVVEALIAVSIAAVFLVVYLRERRDGRSREDEEEQES